MTVENSVELILKYWEDIDYLYHEQIVLAIEKMFILKTYDFTQSLKEWQKVLVKGRQYLTTPDVSKMMKEYTNE